MNGKMIEDIVKQVVAKLNQTNETTSDGSIPVGVSARHIHLQQEHVEALFGNKYELTKRQELSQPGQFAANETLMIAGPKGSIQRVRILGPVRPASQVEVSLTDAFALGAKPPLRESGNIAGSSPITLIGPNGSVHLNEGLIIAQAHIHMNPQEAETLQVTDGQFVQVEVNSERPMTMNQVKVRVSERYALEMHIDTDEANAGFIKQGAIGRIVLPDDSPVSFEGQKTSEPEVLAKPTSNIKVYDKKLLSKEALETITEDVIHITKQTIVTALAYDYAREQKKTIKIV